MLKPGQKTFWGWQEGVFEEENPIPKLIDMLKESSMYAVRMEQVKDFNEASNITTDVIRVA